jgi:hypothetical protein
MEHKLIQGGEQYLPFARSRIKALRATGLAFASQQFRINDTTIEVDIKGQHDYIRITGGAQQLQMDSGLVDVLSATEGTADLYLAGTLHETQSVGSYNAPFVLPAVSATTRLNPATDGAGQLAGTVSIGTKFKGHVPVDGLAARSFSPGRVEKTPPAPPATDPKPDDASLAAKKIAAAGCPASVFTGRCRLYVQSMYGRHLYAQETLSAIPVEPPELNDDTAPPSLKLKAFKRGSDETIYPKVSITTSCGVHLDDDGVHWLFCPGLDSLAVYRLVAPARVEALRAYLKAVPDARHTLNTPDRQRLEAYVLAYCLPDAKNVAWITPNLALHAVSMGYGWHWNWSGTLADIVVNDTVDMPPEGAYRPSCMESTHYRLAMTGNGTTGWSAAISTVEGPTRWTVQRLFHCITEPEWFNLAQRKVTPRFTSLFVCDAPFYAFYLGDTLQMCRVTVTRPAAAAATRSMTPGFANSTTAGTTVQGITTGLLGGFLEDYNGDSAHYVTTFTIGAHTTDELYLDRVATGNRYDISGKTELPFVSLPGSTSATFENYVYEFGYPNPPPFGPYETTTLFSQRAGGSGPDIVYSLRQSNFTQTYTSEAVIVAPTFDAEAMFVQAKCTKTRQETTATTQQRNATFVGGSNYVTHEHTNIPNPPGSPIAGPTFVKYNPRALGDDGGAPGPAVSTPLIVTVDVLSEKNVLCGRAGEVEAEFGDLSLFRHGEDEEVMVTFKALSGAASESPVVISPQRITQVGVVGDYEEPVLVGWT